MGVFKRVADVTRASVHEALDKMEDPIVMMNQYLRDMEEKIAQAEVTVAKHMAHERRTAHRLAETRQLATKLQQQAEQAVSDENDDAARQVLTEKLTVDDRIQSLTVQAEEAKRQSASLSSQLQEMKEAYYQMRNKRNEYAARAQVAEASHKMAQIQETPVFSSSDTTRNFQRMEERVLQMEAEADVARSYRPRSEFTGSVSAATTDPAVEAELSRLKEQMSPTAHAVGHSEN